MQQEQDIYIYIYKLGLSETYSTPLPSAPLQMNEHKNARNRKYVECQNKTHFKIK